MQEAKERIKKRAICKNHNTLILEQGDKVRLVNFKKLKDPSLKDEPNWWSEIYEILALPPHSAKSQSHNLGHSRVSPTILIRPRQRRCCSISIQSR